MKFDQCSHHFRCRRPMPFNCIFYCGYFDTYHSGLARSHLFFVPVYIVKISTVQLLAFKIMTSVIMICWKLSWDFSKTCQITCQIGNTISNLQYIQDINDVIVSMITVVDFRAKRAKGRISSENILVLFPLPQKCTVFYPELCILNFPALGHYSAVRVSW